VDFIRYRRASSDSKLFIDPMHPERQYTAEQILKAYLGETKFYTHFWKEDNLHRWFFELPQKSDFLDSFAEAGRMALVINLKKVKIKLGRE
jgi:hypothetical protein